MKNHLAILGFIFLLSCGNSAKENVEPQFEEQELSFSHLKSGYDKDKSSWIKDPKNLLMLHETFKKSGYRWNVISDYRWNTSGAFWYLDVSRAPKHLVDSLELAFHAPTEFPKYYREFWKRRATEGNQEVVYQVLREIKEIMIDGREIQSNNEFVNDTLFKLLQYENQHREYLDHEAHDLLQYLIEIGLHQSAYNLRSGEYWKFENVKWDNKLQDVVSTLSKKKEGNQNRPWYEDNTK